VVKRLRATEVRVRHFAALLQPRIKNEKALKLHKREEALGNESHAGRPISHAFHRNRFQKLRRLVGQVLRLLAPFICEPALVLGEGGGERE
jgi:hypothetical protein